MENDAPLPHILHSGPPISVGLTEHHGMADELRQYPPKGISYAFLKPKHSKYRFISSPIKGYFQKYDVAGVDIIEAILSPIFTGSKWIYSIANFQEALAFGFLGAPTPRAFRTYIMKHLFLRKNFKRLIFWSKYGLSTLFSYGGISDKRILDKATVVYPAIRRIPDKQIMQVHDNINILFNGDFFRKGGVNVVDAFEHIQGKFPHIKLKLVLCCDETIDFNTPNQTLKATYLGKIKNNNSIICQRVPREQMISRILPSADIYLLPTYYETFGFAILEAMAFGIPVLSTNHFAIPEMVAHEKSGFLVDMKDYDCERLFKGYIVDAIPDRLNHHITSQIITYLSALVESPSLRREFGMSGMAVARELFSFEKRNVIMRQIYMEALQ